MWRRESENKNSELTGLHTNADIVDIVKSRSLIWAGHVIRTQNSTLHLVLLVGRETGDCWENIDFSGGI